MTNDQVILIQRTWQQMMPASEDIARTFYQLLFNQHPELARLFPADFQLQVDKMAATIETIVSSLDRLDLLLPQVQLMGIRHAYYRVKLEHYAPVREAMLEAFKQHLKDQWTDELATAWEQAYDLLAHTMQEAQARISYEEDNALRRTSKN
jgi:hemoglobin-like flavoprotein